jgi:hypothetical protein
MILLTLVSGIEGLGLVIIILVSSANKTILELSFDICGKYIGNKSGCLRVDHSGFVSRQMHGRANVSLPHTGCRTHPLSRDKTAGQWSCKVHSDVKCHWSSEMAGRYVAVVGRFWRWPTSLTALAYYPPPPPPKGWKIFFCFLWGGGGGGHRLDGGTDRRSTANRPEW